MKPVDITNYIEQIGNDISIYRSILKDLRVDFQSNRAIILAIDDYFYNINPKIRPSYYDELRKSGTFNDLKKAVEVISESPLNDYESQYRFANVLLDGLIVSRNITAGITILKRISEKYNKYRYCYFDSVIKYDLSGLYPDIYKQALDNKEDSGFRYRLFICFSKGIGTEIDPIVALKLIKTCDEKYYIDAADLIITNKLSNEYDYCESILTNSDNPLKYSRLSMLSYQRVGLNEEVCALMERSITLIMPEVINIINEILDQDSSLDWKYRVYSTFLNCNKEEDRIDVLLNVPPAKGKIRQFQLMILDLLNELVNICKKLNLDIIGSGGTILGAVRHHGFIWWDDDADVRMFEKDILKLKKYLLKTNSPFYITEFNKWGQFYKFQSCVSNCWIDIFPMESVLVYDGYEVSINHSVHKNSLYPGLVSIRYQCKRSSHPTTINQVMNEDDLYPIIYLPFENILVPVPHNYKKFLKQKFGNYMDLPFNKKIHLSNSNLDKSIQFVSDKYRISDSCLLPLSTMNDTESNEWIKKLCKIFSIDYTYYFKNDKIVRSDKSYAEFISHCKQLISTGDYQWEYCEYKSIKIDSKLKIELLSYLDTL